MIDKGKRGLVYEIKAIDKIRQSKKAKGEPTRFEDALLKSYMRHLKRQDPLAYSQISLEWQIRGVKPKSNSKRRGGK